MDELYCDIQRLRRRGKKEKALRRYAEYQRIKECLRDIEVLWPNEEPKKQSPIVPPSDIRRELEGEDFVTVSS